MSQEFAIQKAKPWLLSFVQRMLSLCRASARYLTEFNYTFKRYFGLGAIICLYASLDVASGAICLVP